MNSVPWKSEENGKLRYVQDLLGDQFPYGRRAQEIEIASDNMQAA